MKIFACLTTLAAALLLSVSLTTHATHAADGHVVLQTADAIDPDDNAWVNYSEHGTDLSACQEALQAAEVEWGKHYGVGPVTVRKWRCVWN